VFLTNHERRDGLLSDKDYTQVKKVVVPRKTNGDFYVVIKTDRYNHVYEHLNEENNIGISEVRNNVIRNRSIPLLNLDLIVL